jgi:7-cyano-7-deazaguanine synthase
MTDGVAVVSGGLDSVTMLYKYCYELGRQPLVLSFDYGQRHGIPELNAAGVHANLLGLRHVVIDMETIAYALRSSKSALTNRNIDVPEGRYDADSMKSTIVPNRNMIMLSQAVGVCISVGGCYVSTAVHAGDHAIYPDCRPEFIDRLNEAVNAGNEGQLGLDFDGVVQHWLGIEAPFINMTKTDIASLAGELNVPIEKTWSCYKGGKVHCGRCGTCVERLEAIHDAGIEDPTTYEDTEFWKSQVQA